jgi:hypothetical protein
MARRNRLAEAASNSPTSSRLSTGGELLRQAGKRQVFQHALPLERLDVEEPQRRHALRHRLRSQLPLTEQVKLVLPDMLRTKPAGSTSEVFGKLLDRKQIGSCGARGIVATLEFFEHPVSKLSHKKYLL